MKKHLMILVSLVLLLSTSLLPGEKAAANGQFSDLNGHGSTKEIMYLYTKHIIGGYPDGTFKPNQPITRAQAAAMLVKALDIKLIQNPTVKFKDVPTSSKYYQILATINEKGIIRGDNGLMRPGEQTSRAQMAAILRRTFDLPLEQGQAFKDVKANHWAFGDINSIAKQRITGGYPDGSFKPSNAVTRAQFSAFLARALNDDMKIDSSNPTPEKPEPPKSTGVLKGTTVERDGWMYTIRDGKLLKINQQTKEEIELMNRYQFEPNDIIVEYRLGKDFPILLYKNDIYIPYWSHVGIMSDWPYGYGLMKTTTDGGKVEEITMQGVKRSFSIRNVYIWNDRIYYTSEEKERTFDFGFDTNVNIDDNLFLYSANLDGSDAKRESRLAARVIFMEMEGYVYDPVRPNINQYNKSVGYDQQNMYYFNKTGIFKYDLGTKKTMKLSSVQGKDMIITKTGIEITDVKGKKHTLKK